MPALLPMPDFVARIRELTSPAVDAGGVQAFLGTHLIEPASIEPYVRYAAGRYTRHLVFKNAAVELLVLCWGRGSHAPIHGHEGELCWARVERGHLASRATVSCRGARFASPRWGARSTRGRATSMVRPTSTRWRRWARMP
jgi:hypothetical protein